MRVLMVTNSYPDFPGSHRGLFIRKLCLHMNKQGVEIKVLTPRIHSRSPFTEHDEGITIHRFRFPSGNRPLNQLESIPVLPMAVYMITGLAGALQLAAQWKPHVIHGNWILPTGLIAALAGRFLRIPVLNTARGMDVRISERQPLRALFGLAVRLSDMATVVSSSMRTRTCLEHASITPTGVDDAFFDVHRGRITKTILYTRSLERVYDAETLIRAMPIVRERVPEGRLIIAGSGSQEVFLRTLARNTGPGDSITFLGLVPSDHIPALMEQASVFVSPALSDGTSIALMEAIAAGLIPVVTDIDANRPLIRNGMDGLLFEPGNEKDLAEKIITAFSGAIPPGTLDIKRKEYRSRVSWRSVAGDFISLYKGFSQGRT